MKIQNILLSTLALVSVLLLSSFWSGNQADFRKALKRSPETRANAITEIMKRKLDLSDPQAEKAYQINLKYAQELQPFVEAANKQSWHSEEAETLNKERKEELLAILTPAQIEKATQIRKQWIARLEYTLKKLKEEDIKQ